MLVYLKHNTDWGLGAKPPAVGRFFVSFLEKTAILMPLNHISHVFRPFESTKFLKFASQWKR